MTKSTVTEISFHRAVSVEIFTDTVKNDRRPDGYDVVKVYVTNDNGEAIELTLFGTDGIHLPFTFLGERNG